MSTTPDGPAVLKYGGGRQTVAVCVLIARGILPVPDHAVIADTGREKRSTWEYLDRYTAPLMRSLGVPIEVAQHSLATVDLYSHQGLLLVPAFTAAGKLSTFCSSEWKREVASRHMRAKGVRSGTNWIGFAADETRRIKSLHRGGWGVRFPLVELMLTKANCVRIIEGFGWPLPEPSCCYICPNQRNWQWKLIRDRRPDEWEAACLEDERLREDDIAAGNSGIYLHHSRIPLRDADLDTDGQSEPLGQCGLGTCFL